MKSTLNMPAHHDLYAQCASTQFEFVTGRGSGTPVTVTLTAKSAEIHCWEVSITLGSVLPKNLSLINLGIQDVLYETEIRAAAADLEISSPKAGGGWETKPANGIIQPTGVRRKSGNFSIKEENICFLQTGTKTQINFEVIGPKRPKCADFNWPGITAASHGDLPPPFPPGSGEH